MDKENSFRIHKDAFSTLQERRRLFPPSRVVNVAPKVAEGQSKRSSTARQVEGKIDDNTLMGRSVISHLKAFGQECSAWVAVDATSTMAVQCR